MRILFVNSIGRNKYGGGEKWMILAAAGLFRAGHSVELAGRANSRLLETASQVRIPVHALSAFHPLAFFQIAMLFRRTRFDVVVCNLNRDAASAGFLSRGTEGPVVIARHGVPVFGKPKRRYRRLVRRGIDGILTNTVSIKERYEKYGWFSDGFIEVIYNGVPPQADVEPFDFSRVFPDKVTLFSAGRLARQKGFIHLIEAASLLAERRSDLAFAVAGKGRLEGVLKQAVERRGLDRQFRFLGFVDSVDPYLKGCDVFVLPSLFEGMPNAVMEAMALGKPVILSDVNGARELVEDGKSGIIVPPADAGALAGAIERLVDDPALRAGLGRAARDRVRERFTIEAMVTHLESYFETKIREKRNRSRRG
jgi:glycosyltransferase involved in cell wall biosynthesis